MPEVVKTLAVITDEPSPDMGEGSATEEANATVEGMSTLFSNEEFQSRVAVVMEAIKDPEKERRCIAEIHTYLSLFEEGFRGFSQEMMNGGGPFSLMRKLMGKG